MQLAAAARDPALVEVEHAAIAGIAADAPLALILGGLAAYIGSIAAPASCAIAICDQPLGKYRIVAAPHIPASLWDVLAAGVEATMRARHGKAANADTGPDAAHVGNAADVHRLVGAATSELLWSRPLADHRGAALGTIVMFGVAAAGPADAARHACEHLAAVANIAIERHRHASELKAADDRLAAVTSAIPGVVYQRRVSPDGDIRYTYISEGAHDLFGVSPREILSDPKALFDCHGPSYRMDFRDRLLEASRTLTMWDVEAEIISRNGTRKWTHAIARPTKLADGSVQWDGIILDATRIARREQALRREKEAAELANRGKSEFIASMSHELRTPLNAIIGFSELMANETMGPLGNPRYRAYCGDILDSGRHLLGIVNDVLDISKIESGKLVLHEEPVEVAAVVNAAMHLVRERAEIAEVAVESWLMEDMPLLFADERLVKQVLLNLLSNAVKFTPKQGRVAVRGGIEHNCVVLQVQDTGIGMDPADIPRAMERFSQIDNSLSRRHEGTGLGLYLVKLFADLHQATIELKSARGVGTTATLRFPSKRTLLR
ncbi:MAG: PAS domain-containing protein [Alphaproteobacteria bacterium]|nr:PAS domain-containing protein [Alphaproteobacteria bacterium]